MYPNPPSTAKITGALQLRGPGQAPRCLSLSYVSLGATSLGLKLSGKNTKANFSAVLATLQRGLS
jgi:hypothetical protein